MANETDVLVVVDAEGKDIEVGNRVRLDDDVLQGEYSYESHEYENSRDFDFGRIESVNADGTVNVSWDGARCGCNSDEQSRVEQASHIVVTNDEAVHLYYFGLDKGEETGRKEVQADLRNLLGLPEPEGK
jgi:hypothetical protein